ncbi:MAG: regulatory signaling modulator protein AmpE [Pseudomonas sp.]
MSFLVVLLVLLIEKLTDWKDQVQHDGPWLRSLSRVESNQRSETSPWLVLALIVLLPVLLLGALLLALEPLAYGWLSLPLHLLVLLYALGRGHAKRELGPFRDAWRRADSEAAALVAERDFGLAAADPRSLMGAIQAHLLWRSHQGFFAVIFWYLLLGPMAALAYRLLALATEHSQLAGVRERAAQLQHAFDWLPVRVLLVSFGLAGNFVTVNRMLLPELLNWHISARQLLAKVGPAAAEAGETKVEEAGIEQLDALESLLVRARVLWYAIIAIWTILG